MSFGKLFSLRPIRTAIVLAGVSAVTYPAIAAKDDIRGVRVGKSLESAIVVLSKDGGKCYFQENKNREECVFNEDGKINAIDISVGEERKIWKVEYSFHFHNTFQEMAVLLKTEYNLTKIGRNNGVDSYVTAGGLISDLQPFPGIKDAAIFSLFDTSLQAKARVMPKF